MAQTIIIKNGTGSIANSDVVKGEPAINTTTGNLYYGDTAGNVSNNFAFGEVTASGNISTSANVYAARLVSNGHQVAWNEGGVTQFGTGANSNYFNNHITASGNISCSGTITANTFHVTHTTSSVITSAGSTTFGNSADDTHNFIGAATIDGNTTLKNAVTDDIYSKGNITASNIIASGYISASKIYAVNNLQIIPQPGIAFASNDHQLQVMGNIQHTGNSFFGNVSSNTHTITGDITASRHISASGTITADNITAISEIQGSIATAAQTGITTLGTLTTINTSGAITASGEISSSGNCMIGGILKINGVNALQRGGGILLIGENAEQTVIDARHDGLSINGSISAITDITASGNISSSKTLTASNIELTSTSEGIRLPASTRLYFGEGFAAGVGSGDVVFSNGLTSNNLGCLGNSVLGNAITDTHTLSGHVTASGNISASGDIYSSTPHYFSTTARVVVANNTTGYYGPNAQGTNYYFWNRSLGTDPLVITSKTSTLNSGWKIPYKAVITGYHLNIQARSHTDNISFGLVVADGLFDGNVTSTSGHGLALCESEQTVTIGAQNNFYELDRRDQFNVPVSAMTMIYPRFKKTVATGGTNYDIQLSIQYRIVK